MANAESLTIKNTIKEVKKRREIRSVFFTHTVVEEVREFLTSLAVAVGP